MPNNFNKKSAEEIALMTEALLDLVPAPPATNALDMSAADRAQLQSASERIAAAIQAQKVADQAARQATLEKTNARSTAIFRLNAIAQAAYLVGIPNSTLARYGFAPQRAPISRPTLPHQVTGLQATVTGPTSALVVYDRGDNRESTVFVIESSLDGASWKVLRSSTRTRESFDIEPGQGLWFRVTATNGVGAAIPSDKASIYTPAAPAAPLLRVA